MEEEKKGLKVEQGKAQRWSGRRAVAQRFAIHYAMERLFYSWSVCVCTQATV